MTEKQIEQLKKVLSDSNLADNSLELDDLILKSAHEAAKENRAKIQSTANSKRIGTFLPISFLRSASLAIVFTIGIFFFMGQMISVDQGVAVLDAPQLKINGVAANDLMDTPNHTTIVRPEKLALEPAPNGSARDQVLMRFELSDTEEMLAMLSIDFSAHDEANLMVLDVAAAQVAILDINSLIQIGELDDARKRYRNLKTECEGCGLPETLEALVIAVQAFTSKSNDSGTG